MFVFADRDLTADRFKLTSDESHGSLYLLSSEGGGHKPFHQGTEWHWGQNSTTSSAAHSSQRQAGSRRSSSSSSAGKRVSAHLFCKNCGVHVCHAPNFPFSSVADVNVHCIHRETVASLTVALVRDEVTVPGTGQPVPVQQQASSHQQEQQQQHQLAAHRQPSSHTHRQQAEPMKQQTVARLALESTALVPPASSRPRVPSDISGTSNASEGSWKGGPGSRRASEPPAMHTHQYHSHSSNSPAASAGGGLNEWQDDEPLTQQQQHQQQQPQQHAREQRGSFSPYRSSGTARHTCVRMFF